MQGKRVFAFVPVGRLRNETRTVVRIGHTKSNKTLDQLFSGFDRPETILLEFGGDTIHNPHECCESLKSVMRGHLTFEGERFDLFANAGCLLGDKYFLCPDDVFDLSRKFEKIARYLFNDQQSTDPRYENQPPVEGEPDQATTPDVSHQLRAASRAVEERERQAEVDQAVNNLRRIGIIQDGVPYQVVPSDVEQLAMVSVSSQQAAAILCGVPGSIRDAIDNPQGPQA